LLQAPFSSVDGKRKRTTAVISQAHDIMPRLQQIARECGSTDARCAGAQISYEIGKGHI
jgi:hypothetical protein